MLGGPALPVYAYPSAAAAGHVAGGPAVPIVVLTASDLVANGGGYEVAGGPASPVYADSTRPVLGGAAVPVFVVGGSFSGGSGVVDAAIILDTDDAYNYGGSLFLTNVTDYAGHHAGNVVTAGLRFQNITIPNGATITAASLQLHAIDVFGNVADVHWKVVAEDADNPPTWGVGDGPGDVVTVTVGVDWDPAAWVGGTDYTSPDIKAVIQEIVNRAGWASGNAIRIVVQDDGTIDGSALGFRDFNSDPLLVAQLHVDYTF